MQIKDRLNFWKLKAKNEKDSWIRFILYWIIFDAYITESSGKDRDDKKLDWFINNDNELKRQFTEFWRLCTYQNFLKNLINLSPISDMRPSKRKNSKIYLKDTNNIGEIINFLYQIRCNTIHGAKDLTNSKDAQLVHCAGELLRQPINIWLVK